VPALRGRAIEAFMTQAAGPVLQKRGAQAIVLCVVATAIFTFADLGSKEWAQSELSRPTDTALDDVCRPGEMHRARHGAVQLVEGYLELRYAENCGAAFGMLNESPKWLRMGLFMTAGAVAIGALMWMFISGTGGALFAWSVPLIVSGALGNMVDRLRLGYVVDFIRFHLQDRWEYPTFNIADATIAVGVALLLIDGLRNRGPVVAKDKPAGTEPASAKAP
jgi:signal peptidase II